MNRLMLTSLCLGIIVLPVASCKPGTKEGRNVSTASTDTTVSQDIRPADSGYADVNGLKMYYEVYGEGKPIVLLHGSFMNIPLNWTHIKGAGIHSHWR